MLPVLIELNVIVLNYLYAPPTAALPTHKGWLFSHNPRKPASAEEEEAEARRWRRRRNVGDLYPVKREEEEEEEECG